MATILNAPRAILVGLVVALAVIGLGCSGDDSDEYDASLRTEFLERCSAGSSDLADECACSWDKITLTIPFERYRDEIRDQVLAGPEAWPADLIGLQTDCVIEAVTE